VCEKNMVFFLSLSDPDIVFARPFFIVSDEIIAEL